jgi:DNA-binding NarL/FixJ family response regulator
MAENLKKAKGTIFSRASAARNREIISMYADGIGYNVIAEKLGRSTRIMMR